MPPRFMDEKQSFWTTLPALIGGIAALITAVAGAYLIIYQSAPKGSPNITPPIQQDKSPRTENDATAKRIKKRIVEIDQALLGLRKEIDQFETEATSQDKAAASMEESVKGAPPNISLPQTSQALALRNVAKQLFTEAQKRRDKVRQLDAELDDLKNQLIAAP